MTATEPIYMRIGANIRRRRKSLNVSQEKLARSLGYTRTSMINIEKGRQRLAVHTLLEFAKVLNISLQRLLA